MANIRDKTGLRFGRLLVLRRDAIQQLHWICQCDCGSILSVRSNNLVSNNTTSCGCFHKEAASKAMKGRANGTTHGLSHTRAHGVWENMIRRCSDPKSVSWRNYGARGIYVAERWLDFQAFFQDMGDPPAGHTLERIDNNGPYAVENCRWATPKEQLRNTRRSHMVTWRGRTQCLTAWAEELEMSKAMLYSRLLLGWDVERAFTTPSQRVLK